MVTSSLTQSIKPGLRHWELGGTALAGMQNLLEGDQEKGDALMSCLGFPGCLWIGITLKRENPRLPEDTQDKWFAFSMQSRTTPFFFFFFLYALVSLNESRIWVASHMNKMEAFSLELTTPSSFRWKPLRKQTTETIQFLRTGVTLHNFTLIFEMTSCP